MIRDLEVWLLGELVGTLSQREGRLSFVYLETWLQRETLQIPLSQSLPLQTTPFDDRLARPFFSGLLPEGGKRESIARALHVSANNDFALLDKIGGECAGAVTLLEPGQTLDVTQSNNTVRWLNANELLKIFEILPKRPMLAGDKDLRLSLAGAQDKLPVVIQNHRVGLPLYNTPSSHILKPEIPGMEGSVFNEGFCLALAKAIKLDVVESSIRQVNGRPYLEVARYDRVLLSDGTLSRLHQEDFCQAQGIAPEYKYENEGGPSLTQNFDLLRKATRPSAKHLLKLLDFVIFNALIGNYDAHAKNFSLIYTTDGPILAPLYDALCTAIYSDLTDKMAMKIGGKYRYKEVLPRHWEKFASLAGLSPAQVKKRLLDIANSLPQLAEQTLDEFKTQDLWHPILPKITTLIEKHCTSTLKRFENDSKI